MTDAYGSPEAVGRDIEGARAIVGDTWEVGPAEVKRGFGRLEQSVVQTGLNRWT